MWNREVTKPTLVDTAQPEPASPKAILVTRIGQSVHIKGDITCAEDLVIDGQVEGTIEASGHRLTIGAGAAILGDVAAGRMSISGAVTGHVTATELITIRETGSVDGDVTAPLVAVREGAVLRGRVDTASAARAEEMPLLRIAV